MMIMTVQAEMRRRKARTKGSHGKRSRSLGMGGRSNDE